MSMHWPIIRQAISTPHRTIVIDDVRQYTYAQLLAGAMVLADAIDTATSAKHVGVLLPASGAFPMAVLAGWIAGRVLVPLNFLLTIDELAYIIEDSDIDTILTVKPMLDFLRQAHSCDHPIPPGIKLIRIDQLNFRSWPTALRWPALPGADDLAVILYSSGTTGKPKGIMLSHANLRSNVDAAVQHAQITDDDTFLGVLPPFHSFGLTALTLIPLRVGAKVVYTSRFIPKKIIQLIRDHQPEVLMAVPSMYGALLSVKDATAQDLSSVRCAISGGEPLPQDTFDAYQTRFNLRLLEGYGLTETSPITNWSTPQRCKPRSVGPALPGVNVIVVDENDKLLPPDQDGEILIAGPNVMKGYYKQDQLTQQVFVDLQAPASANTASLHRFFRTGDIGHLDDQGFLYITGRKKEMLIIGGENVFPREIEEVLNNAPSVRDSAVIGKTDGLRGQVPIGFVEIHEDHPFNATDLRSFCRQHLAGYKVPREIYQVDTLPRSPTGKILRRSLPTS